MVVPRFEQDISRVQVRKVTDGAKFFCVKMLQYD